MNLQTASWCLGRFPVVHERQFNDSGLSNWIPFLAPYSDIRPPLIIYTILKTTTATGQVMRLPFITVYQNYYNRDCLTHYRNLSFHPFRFPLILNFQNREPEMHTNVNMIEKQLIKSQKNGKKK